MQECTLFSPPSSFGGEKKEEKKPTSPKANSVARSRLIISRRLAHPPPARGYFAA